MESIVPNGQPAPIELIDATIANLQAALAAGALSSRELVAWHLARIAAYDQQGPSLNAISCVNERALDEADALDAERRAHGPRGPLHGIPVVVKDNYDTRDMPTTAGSILLKGWVPADDATLVTRLRGTGAIIVAKANMHEFAYGYLGAGSLYGQTRNPYALEYSPGGSSSGTGAAVAASFAVAGLGTDTSGSIRVPAAMNSLVGLRATPGLMSRAGNVPMSHTQDMGGPMARTVADLAIVLDALVGYDPADPITAEGVGHIPPSYTTSLDPSALQGARIGLVTQLFELEPNDPEVLAVVRAAADEMRVRGAGVVEVPVPGLVDLLVGPPLTLVADEMEADMDAYLAAHPTAPVRSFRGIVESDRCIPQVTMALARSLAVDHANTRGKLDKQERRGALRLALLGAMAERQLDALLYPVSRIKAPTIEASAPYNVSIAPCAGLPAISVPAGYTTEGVPVGVELLGRAWSEPRLLALSFAFEQVTHHRRPPASTPALSQS